MPKKKKNTEETQPIVPRPAPYPIDEAIEAAHNIILTEEDQRTVEEDWDSEEQGNESENGRAGAHGSVPGSDEQSSAGSEQSVEQDAGKGKNGGGQSVSRLLLSLDQEDGSSESARARPNVPETLSQYLKPLSKWEQAYILALMECGGALGLAAHKINVSTNSVRKRRAESPKFDAACNEAIEYANDLMEAAGFRGATVGDLAPVYQGGALVGYKRQRSPKDLEIMLKVRGRLKDEPAHVNVNTLTKVTVSTVAEVPELVAETIERLYQARGRQPIIDVTPQ